MIFRTTALTLLLTITLGAAPTTAPTAAPDDTTTPRVLVQSILSQVLVILRNPDLTKSQRSDAVRQIADQHIDFEILSRLTMARNWRSLSDSQRAAFVTEFRKHLVATYAHTTDNYTDQDLTVVGDRTESNNDATVQTHIVGTKSNDSRQSTVNVDYRLRQRDGHWKVIDITVDGVSLVANFRSQFQEIMSNGGFDQLLQLLRDKNAADQN